MSRCPCLLVPAFVFILGACESSDGPPPPTTDVMLSSGPIRGARDGSVFRYRGIPYAKPPVGPLRFAPPEAPAPWTELREATQPSPRCAQASSELEGLVGEEDCLYLDVTVPAAPADTLRPVMVWLHGGGFTTGAGVDYDPARMALQGDVIVVTVEFRLGALASPALPEMTHPGSYLLLDQQQALRWVRENARAFGGDADNVTIFGESGGGVGVCAQLVSPTAEGLFDEAIMQSGTCGTTLLRNNAGPESPATPFFRSLAESEAATLELLAANGCPTAPGPARLECLRSLPLRALFERADLFNPAAFGTEVLPAHPVAQLEAGAFHPVPVLSGTTQDEGDLFAGLLSLLQAPITAQDVEERFRQSFGDRADEVRARYPDAAFDSPAHAWARAHTDAVFTCPHVSANAALSRTTTVYAYEFADRTAPPAVPTLDFSTGASHASELPYLFDMPTQPIDIEGQRIPLNAEQQAVAEEMIRVWTGFARAGHPPIDRSRWLAWPGGSPSGVAYPFAPPAGSSAAAELSGPHQCEYWLDHPLVPRGS